MAKNKSIPSKFKGVRCREHNTRKHGIRKDKYFSIRYIFNGKSIEEGFGWESEGFTEKAAFDAVCEIKQNIKHSSGYFSIKEKQEIELKRREVETRKKEVEEEENITFAIFFEDFYKTLHLNSKSEAYKNNQDGHFRNYIKEYIGDKSLKDICVIDIETIKQKAIEKKLAPKTVNHIITTINTVFEKATDWNKFDGRNPATIVEKIKQDNDRLRFFTEDEASNLLERLSEIHYYEDKIKKYNFIVHDYSMLSLDSGLRAKECFNLKWFDIELDRKDIIIRDPKNSINRILPMTKRVFNMLNKRKKELHSDFKLNDYVFKDRNNDKIKEVSDAYQKTVDDLGFNKNIDDRRMKAVFHTLRHTFASWLVQRGVDIYTVQKLMGHKDIKMTMRYSHLAPQSYKNAISVLDE